jgi:hypothetical protein
VLEVALLKASMEVANSLEVLEDAKILLTLSAKGLIAKS